MNLKAIATLGIGFGLLAISQIGLGTGTDYNNIFNQPNLLPPIVVQHIPTGGGGGIGVRRPDYQMHNKSIYLHKDIPISIQVKIGDNNYDKIYVINPMPTSINISIGTITKVIDKISIEFLNTNS